MELIPLSICSLLFALLANVANAQNGSPVAIRIACGSSEDSLSPKGTRWLKDFGFTGGKAARIDLYNAVAPQLRTVRYFEMSDGPENCYNVTVPNAHYLVRFVFAYGSIDNSYLEPQFDVSIEGTLIYTMNRPGWNLDRSLSYAESLVHIEDGAVTACFHSSGHGNPSISTMEVRQIQDGAYELGESWSHHVVMKVVKRVSCSANATGYESEFDGNGWTGDRYWEHDKDLDKGLTSRLTTSESIKGASVAPNFFPESIYQTSSTGGVGISLSYNVQVEPSQNYSLWFHFAEISPNISTKEQRVFDILVNRKAIFLDVDIIGYTGAKFTALVLNKTILVEGRTLSITFRPVQGAISINAFEIYQVIRTEYTTDAREVWALQTLKRTLALPSRFGWNGDPCVPQEHPWNGVNCGFNFDKGSWFLDGMDLDNQGLKGYIPKDLSYLTRLQTINMSGNSIYGELPPDIGNLTELLILDVSYNKLNGSIPENFGKLSRLTKLYLNGNRLSGPVPTMLLAGPIHGASFNFSDNLNLCGIPGLKPCGFTLSSGAKVGIAFSALVVALVAVTCGCCLWKRGENIARASKNSRNAPYAKSRTNFSKEMQLSSMSRISDLGSPYREQNGSREEIPQLL